ncbi:hypothetical protein S40288_11386 [Stachybotrys chartarum IBT 40288]|nr:hypothetical protein S40288_11386 [Stachybotrys chartarum IBT 40288]
MLRQFTSQKARTGRGSTPDPVSPTRRKKLPYTFTDQQQPFESLFPDQSIWELCQRDEYAPFKPLVMDPNPLIACQCGSVSFRAPRSKPLEVFICHCLECRKQSASAFGVSAIFPTEGILPLPDHLVSQVGLWKRPTDSGNTLECYFCKTCGVRMLHRGILPDGTSKPTISVKGGCLEGLSLDVVTHIFTKTALVAVPEGSFEGEPPVKPGMKSG